MQHSLFESQEPLASRLRPTTLDEYIGQKHLIDKDKILWQLIHNDTIPSMIFWGPPGVGKTTLARIIANQTKAQFIDFSAVTSGIKDIKEVRRGRIKEYLNYHKDAVYSEVIKDIWKIKCDIALPCATQNEIDEDSALELVSNGCRYVAEGANMPSTLEAIEVYKRNKVVFLPAKAANAGGVATSALEMAQSSQRLFWTREEVDKKLKDIMVNIYHNIDEASKRYGYEGDYLMGANIAGFEKVAEAMMAQGVC